MWQYHTQKPIGTLVETFCKYLVFRWVCELCCRIIIWFRVCICPDRIQIASWLTYEKTNVNHWFTNWFLKKSQRWLYGMLKVVTSVTYQFRHEHDLQNALFLLKQQSARSSTMKSEIDNESWWHKKLICMFIGCFKKFGSSRESECYSELYCHIVTKFQVCIAPYIVQIRSWVIYCERKVGHWATS